MSGRSVYDELGVPTVVNASGTKTRIGGSRIREEALEAMHEAAGSFVRLSDLQARASERIAEVTGAEAGYVTNGAAGALLLGTAACIAGTDPGAMSRLPDTEGFADEVVMPRTHRTGYDHAFRAAGATIVDIGTNDRHLGTGSRNVELWEYEDAISEDTAAVGYIYKSYVDPPLSEVCDLAHEHDVPVIVDAAAELPPVENLSWFTEQGADIVAFSGGKAIRGPQTTGILAGRADLVESVAAQHLDMHAAEDVWEPPSALLDTSQFAGVPKQGIGRPLKVGKEELVGLLKALELFVEEDHEANRREWRAMADEIAEKLAPIEGVTTTVNDGDTDVAATVSVSVDAGAAGRSATDIVSGLRREEPRVFVGADELRNERFTVNPMCLTKSEAEYVVDRIEAHARGEA
ncbi:aminotransferase class V-fold PLP-dependent enzyme [Halosimplex sp. J119]